MGAKGKRIPVLTPAYGRKYKSKEDCLNDFLLGKEFVFNLENSPLDGSHCTIGLLYYSVVILRFGSKTILYEGN